MENWYALKIFYNRASALLDEFKKDGIEYYFPTKSVTAKLPNGRTIRKEAPLIPSLLFVKCTNKCIATIRREKYENLMVYGDPLTKQPKAVPQKEMDLFIFVTSAGDQGLEYLGDDEAKYHQGDHVRIIDGIFKGAEGYIKRIKKDRRLVVTVSGVAAVATSFIPPAFMEIID